MLPLLLMLAGDLPPVILLNGSTETAQDWAPTTSQQIVVKPGGRYEYRSITIPSGVTITFLPNATNDPVMLLARDSVVVAGVIDVSGRNSSSGGRGGPGGFDGGFPGQGMALGGAGFGPGGGVNAGSPFNYIYGAGAHATRSDAGAPSSVVTYGRPSAIPLIGGSGGSGSSTTARGGGGGGALLIAAEGTITITGDVLAMGGEHSHDGVAYAGAGAGGTIRLLARDVTASGALRAHGGSSQYGGLGFIRVDAITRSVTNSYPGASLGTNLVVELNDMPQIELVSVAGVASNGVSQTITLGVTELASQPVVVGLSHFPQCAFVTIRVVPNQGAPTTLTQTTQQATLTTNVTIPPNLPTTIEVFGTPTACEQ